jgi:hypothetical protein
MNLYLILFVLFVVLVSLGHGLTMQPRMALNFLDLFASGSPMLGLQV